MIWMVGAILFGVILGVLGFYFRTVFFHLVPLSGFIFLIFARMNRGKLELADINKPKWDDVNLSEMIPESAQWAVLFFVMSFFVARIAIWFLTMKNILPSYAEEDSRSDSMKELEQWERHLNEGSSPWSG